MPGGSSLRYVRSGQLDEAAPLVQQQLDPLPHGELALLMLLLDAILRRRRARNGYFISRRRVILS